MTIRRSTTAEAKALKSFGPCIGEWCIDNWLGELFASALAQAVIQRINENGEAEVLMQSMAAAL